jgi:DNA polymerase-3 subunit delta
MSKEVNQILTDLKRRIFKPVYFLSGEEPYYVDVISDYIESNVLDESERDFNQTILYGKDTEMSTVIETAKRFPMMSDYQVVIVKEAQNLKDFGKSASSDDEDSGKKPSGPSPILSYLQHPLPTTILVFCYKYKTLDKRSAIYKAIHKNHVFIESKKIYDNQLPDWINNFVEEHKYKIGPKASYLIGESLGNDLLKISKEIEKLFINLKQGDEITLDLVQDNIGISKEFNVFELQDALAKKDVMKANRIIFYFAANDKDNPPVLVLSQLYGYFSKVLLCHFAPDKSKFGIAQAIGVNPYFADGYIRAMQNYPTNKLKVIFSLLKEYDLKTKGVDNNTEGGEIMKELIFKILH